MKKILISTLILLLLLSVYSVSEEFIDKPLEILFSDKELYKDYFNFFKINNFLKAEYEIEKTFYDTYDLSIYNKKYSLYEQIYVNLKNENKNIILEKNNNYLIKYECKNYKSIKTNDEKNKFLRKIKRSSRDDFYNKWNSIFKINPFYLKKMFKCKEKIIKFYNKTNILLLKEIFTKIGKNEIKIYGLEIIKLDLNSKVRNKLVLKEKEKNINVYVYLMNIIKNENPIFILEKQYQVINDIIKIFIFLILLLAVIFILNKVV